MLTSVGAGLLESSMWACASDISDSFSSSSSWMGDDGERRVLQSYERLSKQEAEVWLNTSTLPELLTGCCRVNRMDWKSHELMFWEMETTSLWSPAVTWCEIHAGTHVTVCKSAIIILYNIMLFCYIVIVYSLNFKKCALLNFSLIYLYVLMNAFCSTLLFFSKIWMRSNKNW